MYTAPNSTHRTCTHSIHRCRILEQLDMKVGLVVRVPVHQQNHSWTSTELGLVVRISVHQYDRSCTTRLGLCIHWILQKQRVTMTMTRIGSRNANGHKEIDILLVVAIQLHFGTDRSCNFVVFLYLSNLNYKMVKFSF